MATNFHSSRLVRLAAGLLLGTSLLVLLAVSSVESAPPKEFTKEQVKFFETQVQPILKEQCWKCHSAKKVRGGLRMDSRAAILKGGDLGPAVVPGKADASPLVKAIHYRDGLEMPPSGKMPADKIAVLTRWVEMGLPFSPGSEAIVKDHEPKKGPITDADRDWWAYRPLTRPAVPAVKATSWANNPIDAFVLAKVEAAGLTPVAPAERLAMVRRVYYDVTGLPPTPEEVDAFVRDVRPDAHERLVDRLLASPAYGEKWGRHWLDLVRYAETNGYERDGPKPYAWRFRDYVVGSLNADKPYDRFVVEQLAGDELPGDDPDAIVATGYYRLGLWDDEPPDPRQARADEIDDWVSTTGQVFLGMSIGCARCHDHKKDPLSQGDYYKVAAFFADIRHFSNSRDPRSVSNLTDIAPRADRQAQEADRRRRAERLAELTEAMRRIEDEVIKRMPAADQRASEGPERPAVLRKLRKYFQDDEQKRYVEMRLERLRLEKQPLESKHLALSVNNCLARPPQTHVLVRGNPHAPGAQVAPGFPAITGTADPRIPEADAGARTSGRRQVLARWIASKENAQTARVIANRLWQFHFGRGICPTTNDFGKLGEMPSHPELLDWLASELLAGDWSLKRMHRLILTSSTYRLSSRPDRAALAKDPGNTLLWRFSMRRLTAEEVRDSMLAASGELNRAMGGPGVYPTIPQAVLAGQSRPGEGWGRSSPREQARRSVYVHVKRSLIVPILQTHDLADTDSSCAVRYTTTVPTQALGMLNGDFTNEQAQALAGRLRAEAPNDLSGQVRRAIRLATGREPTEGETSKDVAFVHELRTRNRLDESRALAMYCLLTLNSNEFLYLD